MNLNQPISLPKLGRRSSEAGPDPKDSRIIAPLTNFDLTEGAFSAQNKARRASLALIGAGVAAVCLVGVYTMDQLVQSSSLADQRAAVQSQVDQRNSQLAALSAGGASPEVVTRALTDRRAEVAAAVSGLIDSPKVIQSLERAATSGTTLTQITFIAPTGAAGAAPAAPAAPAATPGATPAAAAPANAYGTLTATATANTYEQVQAFQEAMKSVDVLTNARVNFSGAPGPAGLTITLNADLTDKAASSRAQALQAALSDGKGQ